MFPSESEIGYVNDLSDALRIIAYCSTELGARDMNLARADEHLEFAFTKLESLESPIAKRLKENMFARVVGRRQKTFSTLLAYLENPKFLESRGNHLSYATKTQIQRAAEGLYIRLFEEDDEEQGIPDTQEQNMHSYTSLFPN